MNLQAGTISLPTAGPPATPAPRLPASRQPVSVPAQTASPEPSRQPGADDVRQAARRVGEFLKPSSADLEFQVDGESGKVIVRVIDTQTNQLIRQIPSQELLDISRALDHMQGLLLRQKA